MEALSSVKMTLENCLGTINLCLFWISLTMVTLSCDCYCDTLSLQWPFFAKGLGCLTRVLSFCLKMSGVLHPNWQLFTAVHLIGYVHSIIAYGIIFWGNSPYNNNIFKLQKRAIRIIMNTGNRVSCCELFKKLNILPLHSQYILSLLLFVVQNIEEFTS